MHPVTIYFRSSETHRVLKGLSSRTNLKGADDSAGEPLTILIKILPGKVNFSPLFSTLLILGNANAALYANDNNNN